MLDLLFLPPDSGGFVPVYFSQMDSAIGQQHLRDSFALAPMAAPIDPSKPCYFANSRPCGESLNVGYFALNREAHPPKVSPPPNTVNGCVADGRKCLEF